LADEVNQKENSAESQPGDQNPPEVEELGQSVTSEAGVAGPESLVAQTEVEDLGQGAISEAGVAELESLVVQEDEELATARARIIELEEVLAGKDSDIATLEQSQAETDERLTAVSSSLAEAVASYRTMVVQANPEVIEELITGDTIEAVNESLDKAKALVSKVREGVEAAISLAKVPAGAPERTSPDLSALSPREKIQYAVGGRR